MTAEMATGYTPAAVQRPRYNAFAVTAAQCQTAKTMARKDALPVRAVPNTTDLRVNLQVALWLRWAQVCQGADGKRGVVAMRHKRET